MRSTKMMDSSLLDRFSNFAGKVGNKALLLVYDTEMFSNFTSPNEAGAYDLTMSNIPMNTRVNYFFQSELEYLFHGNKDSCAGKSDDGRDAAASGADGDELHCFLLGSHSTERCDGR